MSWAKYSDFGDAFFPLWVTSNLLVSFLEEVLASGLHSRSKESSQIPSRSASRRWNGDGQVRGMAQLLLWLRHRLSQWPEAAERSPGLCACADNPSPGSLLAPELSPSEEPRISLSPSQPTFLWFLYQINKYMYSLYLLAQLLQFLMNFLGIILQKRVLRA